MHIIQEGDYETDKVYDKFKDQKDNLSIFKLREKELNREFKGNQSNFHLNSRRLINTSTQNTLRHGKSSVFSTI